MADYARGCLRFAGFLCRQPCTEHAELIRILLRVERKGLALWIRCARAAAALGRGHARCLGVVRWLEVRRAAADTVVQGARGWKRVQSEMVQSPRHTHGAR